MPSILNWHPFAINNNKSFNQCTFNMKVINSPYTAETLTDEIFGNFIDSHQAEQSLRSAGLSHLMILKTNKMTVCPAKTQISLGIRPV